MLWTQIVVPFIAEAHGLSKAREEAAAEQVRRAEPARPKLAVEPEPAAPPAKPAVVPPTRAAAAPPVAAKPPPVASEGNGLDLEVDELLSSLTGGKAAVKKAARRPGSMPPTA